MNPETLQLLLSADDTDPDAFYNPAGFDWKKEMDRVRSLKPELEGILGRSLELDDQVQDASYFAQLAAIVPEQSPGPIETAISVIFSAFGNLFTVWSNIPGLVPASTVQSVIVAVQRHDFRYVDGESLSETYSGENPFFQRNNWCYRFFDYN